MTLAYSADSDVAGQGRQTAARVRIRQNVDIKFDERFKTHFQMELGHTADNITTTSGSDRQTNLNVRHAVLDYTTLSGVNLQAGIVPLSDYFGDTGCFPATGTTTRSRFPRLPTDTGFDGDSVNISNNGYGLSTIQAKYAFPVTADLTGYVAAGWFGNTKAPAGRSGDVGTDWLLMGTYRFNNYLVLDFGGAFAKLKDSLSGYGNGIVGGAAFNQGMGVSRNKNALFTRLQAEF